MRHYLNGVECIAAVHRSCQTHAVGPMADPDLRLEVDAISVL